MKNNNEMGARVKELRNHFGLTQSEFSSKLGLSRSHISNIENGNEMPSRSVILLMSAIFSVSIGWLQSGEGQMIDEATQDMISKNNNEFEKTLDEISYLFKKVYASWQQGTYVDLIKSFTDISENCFDEPENENCIIITEILSLLNAMLTACSIKDFKEYKYKVIANLDEIKFKDQ